MGIFAESIKKKQLEGDPFAQLKSVSEKVGVGEQAESIIQRAKKGTFSLLRSTLDILQRPNFAIAGGVKNIIDADPKTTFLAGLKRGIKGEEKQTFTDVLETAGFKPETKAGKFAKGAAGFALDVLLDPTTYLTLGVSAGAKVGKAGVILSRDGTKFLRKAGAIGGQKGLSKQLAGDAILKLTKKNPELAKKWLDQGGLKFFGKTLISGDRVNTALKAIPGVKTVDRLTKPTRDAVGALFNRNIDPTHGKLPNEFIRFEQGFRDLARTEPAEALKRITNIARVNKITSEEAGLISNALEAGTKISDPRLENARSLFKRELGKNIKDERARGIKVGELTNYVPHILVKESTPKIPFKAPVKRVGDLGFKKRRQIIKVADELGKEQIVSKRFLNLRDINKGKLISKVEKTSKKAIGDLQDLIKKLAKPELTKQLGKTRGLIKTIKKQLIPDFSGAIDEVVDATKVNKKLFQQAIENVVGPERRKLETQLAEMEQLLKADVGKEFLNKPLEVRKKIIDARQKKIVELNDKILKTQNKTLEKIREIEAFDFISPEGKKFKQIDAQPTIKEINKEFGKEFFNENIIEATAIRGLASKKAQLGADFLREAAQNFGVKASQAPSGYVKSTAKGLEDFMFHPAIAKRIDDFTGVLINDEATSKLLRAFDDIQNLWKASVTSIFPAFHGRNAISNVFLNFMDMGKSVFDPGDIALSTSMLVKNRKLEKLEEQILKGGDEGIAAAKEMSKINNEILMTDNFGTEWSTGALRSLAKRNNIALTDDFFAADIPTAAGKVIPSKLRQALPVFQDFYLFKKGKEFGSAIEGQARMQNFFHHLKNTGDPITAAERTKRFLFDYGNLTEFEKNFLRRLMPFYSFTRKNLEVNVVEGLKKPGRVAAQAKVFNTVGDIMSNSDQATDEEIKTLPEWMQKGLLITIDRKGSDLTFIRNLGLPLEQSLTLGPKSTLDMLSPLLKFPLERVANRDFFRGKDIKDVTNATAFRFAPEAIKEFVGYREVPITPKTGEPFTLYMSTKPRNMHLLTNSPVGSRIWSTLGSLGNTSLPNNAKFLQQTTGLRPFTFNIEKEAARREKEISDELEQLLINAGVGAEFKRFFISKDKKKELGIK